MGFAEFLDHWWNLPFLVMLGLVVVFFALQTIGLVGHDADLDHDVDVDHDVDADVDGDADADADAIGLHDVLAYFGVGKVPFMVVWVTLFIFTGATGLFFNSLFYTRHHGAYPPWGFAASCALSLAVGLVAVRLFSRAASKLVDVGGKGAAAKHELAGKIGVVASARLDAKFGEVRVHDDRGNEILVHARLSSEERTLARGDEVILVEYDADSELFTATAGFVGGARVLASKENDAPDDLTEEDPRAQQDKHRRGR